MVLTAIAGGLLALQIAPRQRDALNSPVEAAALRQLGMLVGVFNLLWTIVVVTTPGNARCTDRASRPTDHFWKALPPKGLHPSVSCHELI